MMLTFLLIVYVAAIIFYVYLFWRNIHHTKKIVQSLNVIIASSPIAYIAGLISEAYSRLILLNVMVVALSLIYVYVKRKR